jgi:hypothetical protein
MTPAAKTLQAINAKLEASQECSHREHLGASLIGRKCTRELWYVFRWAMHQHHPGQLLRLFERGQLEESRFVGYLRSVGCEVWEFNEAAGLKNGKPQQWRISDHSGHFGGSLDGVARGLPDLPFEVPFLTEFKTHNASSFKKLVELGVIGAKWEHFIQMQVYMHKMGLNVGLYMAVCKDTDELHLELVTADPEIAKTAISRAGTVIFANEPPERISESPGAFGCKFCTYNRLCHFGDITPDRNCRTCRFSRPGADSKWLCGLRDIELDKAAQLAGCGSYQVAPALTNG